LSGRESSLPPGAGLGISVAAVGDRWLLRGPNIGHAPGIG